MTMRWRWLIAAGATLAATWAGIDWLQASRASRVAQARTAAELEALRGQTERLRETVATLRQQQARERSDLANDLVAASAATHQAEAPAPADHGAALQVAPRPAPAGPPDLEEEHRQQLEYASYLDQRVEAEPVGVDDEFIASLTRDLEEMLEADGKLVDLRCSGELCRVETRHPDDDAYRAFQARGFRQEHRLWSGPATFIVLQRSEGADRPLVAAMYLGRGDALPSPERTR